MCTRKEKTSASALAGPPETEYGFGRQRRTKQKAEAILQNARTMAERRELIEKLGGVFYEGPKACPHLDLP